jgi:hypothetical protein
MPIVINELIIRGIVEESQGQNQSVQSSADALDKSEIVEECVNQVLSILKRRDER